MSTIKDEILSIATEQGYEGDAPKTIAQAVNALGTVMGGGGGGDIVYIHGEEDPEDDTYIKLDCPDASVIAEAFRSGKLVVARISNSDNYVSFYNLFDCSYYYDVWHAEFSRVTTSLTAGVDHARISGFMWTGGTEYVHQSFVTV